MRFKVIIVLLFFLIPGVYILLFPCTVFYASQDDKTLGGNNEDWSDPNTGIFFIPAEGGKNGWVKFGFMGGWPQGGMNDKGLFWDATACTFLEMPYSEANKEKFDGPLMQKVMEDCGTVQEALTIFEKYYCDDQYNAQYLIGDTTGTSVIVEGDNLIMKDKNYQVMTNFYQSHPELGGYPCWRYETAVSMLESSNEISTNLFGAILSATHQEGAYPTQYSNMYDLKRGIIYLFYFHNYVEFIQISLKDELEKGSRIYSLPSLFSQIQIVAPTPEEDINSSSVTFKWKGKLKSKYELYYSTNQNFTDCDPITVTCHKSNNLSGTMFSFIIIGIIFITGISRKNRRSILFGILNFVMILFIFRCGDNVVTPSESEIGEMSITVENLESNTIYYWKVVASPEGNDTFLSESFVQTFTTES